MESFREELKRFKKYGGGLFNRLASKIKQKIKKGIIISMAIASIASTSAATSRDAEINRLSVLLASSNTQEQIDQTKIQSLADIIEALLMKQKASIVKHIENKEYDEALKELEDLQKNAGAAKDEDLVHFCESIGKSISRMRLKRQALQKAIADHRVLKENGELYFVHIVSSHALQVAVDKAKIEMPALADNLGLVVLGQPTCQATTENGLFTVTMKWKSVEEV